MTARESLCQESHSKPRHRVNVSAILHTLINENHWLLQLRSKQTHHHIFVKVCLITAAAEYDVVCVTEEQILEARAAYLAASMEVNIL